MDFAERIAKLHELRLEQAAHWEHDADEPPRPPAAREAVDALVAEHGLPADYAAFLVACDGWEDVSPGWTLHGCADLADAHENASQTFSDTDTPDEDAARALVVGTSENDAGLLYYDRASRRPDGTMDLVAWLYEETSRYASLIEYLDEVIEGTEEGNRREREARAATRAEWTDAWRRADEQELSAALATRLSAAEQPPPLTADRIAALPWTVHVDPTLPSGSGGPIPSPAALSDPETGATMRLELTVALRASPSPDEVYALLAAFRRRFPDGPSHVKRLSSWSMDAFERWSADDPVLAAAVGEPGSGGAFGVTVEIGAKPGSRAPEGPSLTIHAPGDRDPRVASYLLAMLPVDTDPAAVRGFARDVAELVPFVSGHACFGGVASGMEAVEVVYRWVRRCIAIDVQDLRLELRAMRHAVKGAAWLTMVGAPVADALRARFGDGALRFDRADIAVTEHRNGLVIEAGVLSVGDRAEPFPEALAEVDRRLAPLRITLGNDELLSVGGVFFTSHHDGYDGPIGDGDGSYEWLERWIRPEVWLGPTPRERALALYRALPVPEQGLPVTYSFQDLLRHLFNASHRHASTDAGIAALAFVSRFRGHVQASALATQLYGYLLRGELEAGADLLPLAVELGPDKPLVLHNAACVMARRGDRERAIELVRSAKEHEYDEWRTMHADEDLASLRGDPAFEAIFAEV